MKPHTYQKEGRIKGTAWLILSFAIPIFLSEAFQILYSSADIAILGRFAGGEAVAAVSATISFTNLILNVFVGISNGCGIIAGIHFGAKDKQGFEKTIKASFLLSLASGALIAAFGSLIAPKAVQWMQFPMELRQNSTLYIILFFLGTPALLYFNYSAAILRSSGHLKTPIVILVFSGICNVILNFISVTILHWDVFGVGLSSIFSQYCSAIAMGIILRKTYGMGKNDKTSSGYLEEIKQILGVGIPFGIQGLMLSFSGVIIQSYANTFGALTIAGLAVSHNISDWIITVNSSIAQSSMIHISQNYGARKTKEIKQFFRVGFLLSFLLTGALCIFCLCFSRTLVSIFVFEPESIAAGVLRIQLLMPFFPIYCLQDYCAAALRGIKNAFVSMLGAVFGNLVVRVGWVLCFFPIYPTIHCLLLTYPVSWIASFIPLFILACIKMQKLSKLEEYT